MRVLRKRAVIGACIAAAALAHAAAPAHPEWLKKYAGSANPDLLLQEPIVHAELQKMLGARLPALLHNIDVRGDVGLVAGALVVSGNAPHGGGEEEGIVCVMPEPVIVEAAIASKGRITVFTKAEKYEYAMQCIKDWVTEFNTGHRGRFEQPKNVQVQRSK